MRLYTGAWVGTSFNRKADHPQNGSGRLHCSWQVAMINLHAVAPE